jgi:ribosomal protein L40E
LIITQALSLPTPVYGINLRRHVNPVPYFEQGNKPWCGVATARMIIAYVLYPESPPALEDLAREMGATEKSGTTGNAFEAAMRRRSINAISYDNYDPEFVRSQSAEGYAIEVTKKVYPRLWPANRDLHAIVIIGYDMDRQSFLVHDPDKYAEMPVREDDLRESWYYCEIVKTKPRDTPSYSVRIRVLEKPNLGDNTIWVHIDDKPSSTSLLYKFAIGTSHTIRITPNRFTSENATHRMTYECLSDTDNTFRYRWILDEGIVYFSYQEKAEFWITIRDSTNPRSGWFASHTSIKIESVQRILPADGVLGLLGLITIFRGWYVDGRFLSDNLGVTVVATGPMSIVPRYELDIREGSGMWVLLVIASGAMGTAFVIYLRRGKKASISNARAATTKHCPECGLILPVKVKHCPKCGTKQYYFGED